MPLVKRIAGHLALDFVNTVHGRIGAGRRVGRDWADRIAGDYLETPADLVRWAREAGVIDAAQAARIGRRPALATRRLLARARRLREALYRLCRAAETGWPPRPADLAAVAAEVARARAGERLVPGSGGRLAWSWAPTDAGDRILGPIVLAAADLLTGDRLDRVRRCPGERCGWFFLDQSRAGRRRWCDMADCGTIAKVRRFRRRHPH